MASKGRHAAGNLASGNVTLAVLAATAGYFFIHEPPLEGLRPASAEPAAKMQTQQQTIDARLWQDPFAAIARSIGKSEQHALEQKCLQRPRSSVLCRSPLTDEYKDTLVIAVTLPGGPYPEDAEHRRRTRYAVLAGLQRAGLVPEDASHIGFFCGHRTRQNCPRPCRRRC